MCVKANFVSVLHLVFHAYCVQELKEARGRVSELEKMCSDSEALLERERSSTVTQQQMLTEKQKTSVKVMTRTWDRLKCPY